MGLHPECRAVTLGQLDTVGIAFWLNACDPRWGVEEKKELWNAEHFHVRQLDSIEGAFDIELGTRF